MLRLTINGRGVELEAGATVLEAAQAAAVSVPTLCWHPGLPAQAACRMCLVQINGDPRPQPACSTLAQNGDVVETETEALQAFRQTNAEWLLSRHPNDCMHCEVDGSCQLQSLVREHEWDMPWPAASQNAPDASDPSLTDHTSPSIWRDLSKCIECGLCADACGEPGQQLDVIGFADRGEERRPVTVFDRPLSDTQCISCGQCTLVCPVGALIEAPHWRQVLRRLNSRSQVSVVQVAPATRIAISEEFGFKPGTVSTGRLINALRQLGFDYVFDTNFAADLTIMEEGSELLARVKAQSDLPLFTSCCPGWVNWVELNRPDLLPHLSTTKSPQQMHGALSKRSRFARSLGPEYAEGEKEPYVVSVMPCTAKKDEAARPGQSEDVDHVLTTRELARMIRSRGVAFGALDDDGVFDNPLGASTGAAQIFGASGGVMEAMARTAACLADPQAAPALDWRALRGVNAGVKTADVPGVGAVAVCNGIAAAQRLLHSDEWRTQYVAIEVMACVGGCLGGGGEPKSLDPDVLKKRAQAIYTVDAQAPRRRSIDNPDVQALYATELGHPNSEAAHALLHTQYAGRRSERAVLMQFLDCVDRRDGPAAAALFHPDGLWSTASPYGDVQGAERIEACVASQLPSRKFGPEFARHQMASAADDDDLTVVTPDGQRCRFELVLEPVQQAGGASARIKSLVRRVD